MDYAADGEGGGSSGVLQRDRRAGRQAELARGRAADEAMRRIIAGSNGFAGAFPPGGETRGFVKPSAGHNHILLFMACFRGLGNHVKIGRGRDGVCGGGLRQARHYVFIFERRCKWVGGRCLSGGAARQNGDVGSERSKLRAQLAFRVPLKIQQRGGNGGAACNGDQSDDQSSPACDKEPSQHTPEHYSPLKMGAGSKRAARRSGTTLPVSTTRIASATATGKRIRRAGAAIPNTSSESQRARKIPPA